MLNSELPSLIQICQVAQRLIRSSVNLTTNTYVRVTEFTWILFIFSIVVSFSFSLCDASGLLSLFSSSLLSRQTSSVPQLFCYNSSSLRHGCKWLLLLQSFLFPFTSCGDGLVVGTKRQLSKFEFLLLLLLPLLLFFTCSFSLFKRALSSGRHGPRRQRLAKGLWGLRASNSINHQIPLHFQTAFFFLNF
jgi:hypothetical protein